MSATVVETSTYSASVTVPSVGEPVTAASVLTAIQPLANRTKYLRDRLNETGGKRTFTFVSVGNANPATWYFLDGSFIWFQADVSGTVDRLMCPINLPNGSEITSVDIAVSGDGNHSAVPASPPNASFRKYGAAGQTSIGSATDGTAYPAYDSPHTFSITGLSETVDNENYGYMLSLKGEYGMNSAAGLNVFAVTVHFTPAA